MKSNPESLPNNKEIPDLLSPLRQAEPTHSFNEMHERLLHTDPPLLQRLWVAIAKFLTGHKGLYSKPALAAYGFAVLLIVACQVPTEYTKEIGQALRVTTTSDPEAIAQFVQQQAGVALTDVNITMQVNEDDTKIGEALFSFQEDGIDIEVLAQDIKQFQGVETADIEPITHEFRGSLVTAALHKAIDININITDLTAAEIEQVFKDRFAAEGINADVSVDVTRDSSRSIISIKTELADTTGGGDLPGIILNLQEDNAGRYDQETEDTQVIRIREVGTRSVIQGSEAGTQSAP